MLAFVLQQNAWKVQFQKDSLCQTSNMTFHEGSLKNKQLVWGLLGYCRLIYTCDAWQSTTNSNFFVIYITVTMSCGMSNILREVI